MNLLEYMGRYGMLPEKDGIILCAVSGGRDSICLLHYLYTLGKSIGFSVAAGHLNHLMRDTAQRDVDFVQEFCQQREIPFYMDAVPVYEKAKEWKISAEEAGRRARYEFLTHTADTIGASKIATAHHRNDRVETVLLNLFRGTGPEGLVGIPPVRGQYIRPLLDTSRDEIELYLRENQLTHVEDETNTDTYYARNRLRLELMPQLEKLHPGMADNVCRAADILRVEDEYLAALADEQLPGKGTTVPCSTILSAPEPLRLRMIRLLCGRLPVGKKDFTAVHYMALADLCSKKGQLNLPYGTLAICDGEKLSLCVTESLRPVNLQMGETYWGDYVLQVEKWDGIKRNEAIYLSSIEDVTVSAPKANHRLPTQKGSRTVKRLALDETLSPAQRDSLPALYRGDTLLAVYHLGQVDEPESRIEIIIKHI